MLSLYAKKILNESLMNDVGYGDITTELIIPEEHRSKGEVVVKEDAVICGVNFVSDFLRDHNLRCDLAVREGEWTERDRRVMEIEGNTRKILTLERTILNFLMHLSGIATKTYRVVKKVKEINERVKIACTRKTLPLLSPLEKYAVVIGGGDSHRFRLDDMVMIKDNHIEVLGVEECFKRIRRVSFTKKVEIEVDSIDMLREVLPYKPDIVLLDNFTPKEVEEALEVIEVFSIKLGYRPLVEVSGGIREDNILEYVKYDIDIISMGCLIHSAPGVDMSLNILKK
ncbi:MAG TPA: carboxylating nicotinate-nucleotide diphosphorylase [Methanococcaceae archaeon]|uniref:Nicotinate-nucleotide pyrophosphorylase [carboxylating] n=1 Tax=Methanothermococcus okinawensis TaxID=155863 RepID=A0A833E6F9_9EURY|nr:carboxylating nicotinate-nucleotide diphosphorylase [Methanococcaceae archaeon]HIP91629.1 carboxylating nicotinate-nucleotide diphosphorylase [Methanothermococcus okinawensis]